MDYSTERAADALAFIDQSRMRLVAAAEVPPLRHLAFAAMMGGIVASPALPLAMRGLVSAFVALGLVLIVQWDRRRTGMFINGYRAGKTRRVTAVMLASFLPLYGVSAWLGFKHGAVLIPLALGLVATGLAYLHSIWWCRVFRREMLGRAA